MSLRKCAVADLERDTVRSVHAERWNFIRAWRISQKCSEQALAERAGIAASVLEALESEQADPQASTLEALAGALKIPLPWLFIHPTDLDLLCKETMKSRPPSSTLTGADPVLRENSRGGRT
jgi:transcriptional regulator with XRE-family HTH domain